MKNYEKLIDQFTYEKFQYLRNNNTVVYGFGHVNREFACRQEGNLWEIIHLPTGSYLCFPGYEKIDTAFITIISLLTLRNNWKINLLDLTIAEENSIIRVIQAGFLMESDTPESIVKAKNTHYSPTPLNNMEY